MRTDRVPSLTVTCRSSSSSLMVAAAAAKRGGIGQVGDEIQILLRSNREIIFHCALS